jgi:MFS family permease
MDENKIIRTEAHQPSPVGQTRFQYLAVRFKGKFSLKQTFAALKYPNYNLWFRGQIVSLFGTWMQTTAEGFLVFELTHSPAFLGYVGFATGIPAWLFMFYGGVIADRIPRRKVIIITQTTMMILALILAGLTFAGVVKAWHIIVLAFGLGTANAFDAPARQSFLLELVDRDDLINAIALNSTMFNAARAVGPAVAGVVYALFGPGWCFFVNALSFLGVIVALKKMKFNEMPKREKYGSALKDIIEGLKYTASEPMVRTLIGLVAVINIFGLSFVTLIPAWAVTVLHGNAATNGIMQSARGIGALAAALIIATIGGSRHTYRLLGIGTFIFPLLLLIFAYVRWLPFSLAALLGTGAAIILIFNLSNALVQNLVRDNMRGRVMSVYTFTSFGFFPLGALLIGFGAEHFGEPSAVTVGALITLGFAVMAYTLVPKLRS